MAKCSALAVLAWCLVWALPAGASEIPAAPLLEITPPQPSKLLDHSDLGMHLYYLELARPTDSWEVQEAEIIRDEHLNLLLAFSSSNAAVLPIVSAHMYAVNVNKVSQLKKTPLAELDEWEEMAKKYVVPGMGWLMGQASSDRARLAERAMAGKAKSLDFMGWLTEDEGLLSGRPWDWDNFLPRILAAIGLILGVLLVVECLHIVVLAGLRGLGLKRKQRRSRTQ